MLFLITPSQNTSHGKQKDDIEFQPEADSGQQSLTCFYQKSPKSQKSSRYEKQTLFVFNPNYYHIFCIRLLCLNNRQNYQVVFVACNLLSQMIQVVHREPQKKAKLLFLRRKSNQMINETFLKVTKTLQKSNKD